MQPIPETVARLDWSDALSDHVLLLWCSLNVYFAAYMLLWCETAATIRQDP